MSFRPSAFPLAAKLISGFLLVTVPALAVMAAISLYALSELVKANHHLFELSRSLEAVRGLEVAVQSAVDPLSANLADPAGDSRRFEASFRKAEARLKDCSGGHCHQATRAPRVMAETLEPHLAAIRNRASIFFESSGTEQQRLALLRDIDRQGEEIRHRLGAMSAAVLQRVFRLEEASRQLNHRAVRLIVASMFLVLLLAAGTAYLLSRRLLKPVGELLAGTRHIMQGNLGHRVSVIEGDEIGQLARSFNVMAQELQEHRQKLERMVKAKSAELEAARDSLVQSEKLASIGLLASGVAHELNNPLTSIVMNVNLLMEDAEDQPELRRELQRIIDDTARCKRIIDDLRDFSRRHDLDLVPTDLNRLVEDCLALAGPQLEAHRITTVRRYSPGIPPVPCDPIRMEEVLANVITNAVQAMAEGGRLTVATALRDHEAEISVEDTGPGIPEQVRNRIFDPFFTTKPQGTGLGLSIVYRIMEAHGGKVAVHSPVGGDAHAPWGTRVVLLLPPASRGAERTQEPGTAG